ncbi:hypothetical protein TKK_0019380 [Trichogramma kaykai]
MIELNVELRNNIFKVFLLSSLINLIKAQYTPVIQTQSGPVVGQYLTTLRHRYSYASFKGIPYAEPPLGYLRFQPPVEKRPWGNLLYALSEGSACSQVNQMNFSIIGSEDCLYLNVFTPHVDFSAINSNNLKAVMVWIHGGGFSSGFSNTDFYGPDYLMENDVVLVSFNYRLGIFGFLNLNHPHATGNQALKDQNLVLRWVRQNIAAFGGNPNLVTIFGQSAGAVSVDLHVLSEMSAGLFSRSISMSGSPLCEQWGLQSNVEAEQEAYSVAAQLGIYAGNSQELLNVFYTIPAETFLSVTRSWPFSQFRPTIERTIYGYYDNRFLKHCPLKYYETGRYNKAPHMLGFTSLEPLLYPKASIFILLKNMLRNTLGWDLTPEDDIFQFIQLLHSTGLTDIPIGIVKHVLEMIADRMYILGIDQKQQLMAQNNYFPIYYYRSSYTAGLFSRANRVFNIDGVGHAEDLAFIFHIPHAELSFYDPATNTMIDRYTRLWTNFAKYGNPTPSYETSLGLHWPDSGVWGQHLEMDLYPQTGPRPISQNVANLEAAGHGRSYQSNDCSADDFAFY